MTWAIVETTSNPQSGSISSYCGKKKEDKTVNCNRIDLIKKNQTDHLNIKKKKVGTLYEIFRYLMNDGVGEK